MTPKEKAEEIYNKFFFATFGCATQRNIGAKRCALITVDEIISQWEYIDAYLADMGGQLNPNLKYWQEVKQEIEKP